MLLALLFGHGGWPLEAPFVALWLISPAVARYVSLPSAFLTAANNFGAAGPQRSAAGPLDGGAILSGVFTGTRSFATGLFTTVLFLCFLLVSGDGFLRRFVEVLPSFRSKRQAVDISQ